MKAAGYSTRTGRPEAVLFGLADHGDQSAAAEVLSELGLLADTGNFNVIGHVVQHRKHPDPHTYVGSGKLEELAEVAAQTKAEVVICDESLSPTQGKNIEQAVKVAVLDRSELILHIFGIHARTPQAKLQVELARLQYQLPRLKRMWTHLERQRGGIGVRGGAGEKQIDVDRTALRQQLTSIQRRLGEIQVRKSRQIRTRANLFTIALVGYTNAGKSTLMNCLTSAGTLAEDRLFSTLDTLTRPWRMSGGRSVLLSDTVGFIRNLPHQLVASFHATLEEALEADLLLVLVDASSPESIEQLETVEVVLEQLGATSLPRIYVLNKTDALEDRSQLAGLLLRRPKAVCVSAKTGAGIEDLEQMILEHLRGVERRVQIHIPHSRAALQAHVRHGITVLAESYDDSGCTMDCLISPRLLDELVGKGATVRDPAPD